MPRGSLHEPPRYRPHQASGHAVVTLRGHDCYLGAYGSRESWRRYGELIVQWASAGLNVGQMVERYRQHARTYYRASGELANMTAAADVLVQHFGRTPAAGFGPLELDELREKLIAARLCRNVINARINRVRRIFKWAAGRQIVPAGVYAALQALEPLKRGRSAAHDTEPVRPVGELVVQATLPHLPAPVGDMVMVQYHSGMRSQDVIHMTTGDLDTSGPVWIYTPGRHKTAYRGQKHTVLIGPQAQAYLRPYLKTELGAYLFVPAAHCPARRRRSAGRRPGRCYTSSSYARAIARSCVRARQPHWHPHQLRHAAGTRFRKHGGPEEAQVLLDHRSLKVTEIYAEPDLSRAAALIARIG